MGLLPRRPNKSIMGFRRRLGFDPDSLLLVQVTLNDLKGISIRSFNRV